VLWGDQRAPRQSLEGCPNQKVNSHHHVSFSHARFIREPGRQRFTDYVVYSNEVNTAAPNLHAHLVRSPRESNRDSEEPTDDVQRSEQPWDSVRRIKEPPLVTITREEDHAPESHSPEQKPSLSNMIMAESPDLKPTQRVEVLSRSVEENRQNVSGTRHKEDNSPRSSHHANDVGFLPYVSFRH